MIGEELIGEPLLAEPDVTWSAAAGGYNVPPDWLPHCEVISPERPPVLHVGRNAPPRTVAELEFAADLGLELDIQPQGGLDLHRLAPVLPRLKRLTIGGLQPVHGWDALAQSSLTELWASPSEPLPAIGSLEVLVASGAHSLSGMVSPRLRRADIDLDGGSWTFDGVVAGPLQELQMQSPRGMDRVPELAQPQELSTFRVHRCASLDLSGLADARNLSWLDLSQVREVRGLSVLRNLTRLQELTITGAWILTGWEVLFELDIDRIVIRNNRAIPDEGARALMAHGAGRWHVGLVGEKSS